MMMLEAIGKAAMLEQLAEEAAEHLVEEYTDVCHCVMELDVPVDWAQIEEKRERFMNRVREMRSIDVQK